MGFYQGMLGGVVGAAHGLDLGGDGGGEEESELGAGHGMCFLVTTLSPFLCSVFQCHVFFLKKIS